jgi:hypothetical protein
MSGRFTPSFSLHKADRVLADIKAMSKEQRALLFSALNRQPRVSRSAGFEVLTYELYELLLEAVLKLGNWAIDQRVKRLQRNRKPKNTERDAEIVRLRDEILPDGKQRSFGQIALMLQPKWPGLTSEAANRAYNRAKQIENKEKSKANQ